MFTYEINVAYNANPPDQLIKCWTHLFRIVLPSGTVEDEAVETFHMMCQRLPEYDLMLEKIPTRSSITITRRTPK